MPHERQQIREAIVTQIKGSSPSYNTSAGARVTENMMLPRPEAELPAIGVYDENEDVDPDSYLTSPRRLRRSVEMAVEAWVSLSSGVSASLDTLSLEIETAMDTDLEFGGLAITTTGPRTEKKIYIEGNRPMGVVRLVYTVVYETDLRVAAVEDDFSSADIHYNLSGDQDEDDQAHDVIEDLEA